MSYKDIRELTLNPGFVDLIKSRINEIPGFPVLKQKLLEFLTSEPKPKNWTIGINKKFIKKYEKAFNYQPTDGQVSYPPLNLLMPNVAVFGEKIDYTKNNGMKEYVKEYGMGDDVYRIVDIVPRIGDDPKIIYARKILRAIRNGDSKYKLYYNPDKTNAMDVLNSIQTYPQLDADAYSLSDFDPTKTPEEPSLENGSKYNTETYFNLNIPGIGILFIIIVGILIIMYFYQVFIAQQKFITK